MKIVLPEFQFVRIEERMGITDRQYMNDASRSFGTFRGFDITAVVMLLLINVAVWIVWQFSLHSEELNQFMVANFMSSPVITFKLWHFHTLLTATISHIDPYHLLFNMLFFWYLGRDVEVFYGRNNFVALYVFCGVFSSAAQCALESFQGSQIPMLGASGAVMGVAAAAAFIDPRKRLYIWGILPVELWMLVPAYAIMDFSGMMNNGGNIAHAAHLGGAAAGALFYMLDLRVFSSRGRKRSGIVYRIRQWWRSRKFRVVESRREHAVDDRQGSWNDDEGLVSARKERATKLVVVNRNSVIEPPSKFVDPETALRVDQLLAKISREGIESLNSDERDFLKRSSEKYKR